MGKTLGTTAARRKDARPKPTRYDSQSKCNRWMVTLNFGEEDELEELSHRATIALQRLNAGAQVPPCTYAVFQPEKGVSGRLHIQGYFEFNKRMTAKQVRDHLGDMVFVKACNENDDTQQHCIDYCKKIGEGGRVEGGEVVEFGTPMKLNKKGKTSGSRTDWADIVQMCRNGAQNAEIIVKHPAVAPNARALQHVRFAFQCERSREETTKLLVLWGSPDAGKTTTAISLCEPGSYYVVTSDGKSLWWDGYDPDKHRTVIFDEFVGSRMPITFLNQLADKIDINVQTKGGFARFLAQHIIITSNFSPREWYNQCAEARQEAMFRRITAEVEFQLVDEIIDMRQPQNMERRLHLRVHKGKFPFLVLKTRYPLDNCCKAIAEHEADDALEPIDSSVEHDAQSPELGDSQEVAIVIDDEAEEGSSDEDEEDGSSDADPGSYSDFEEWNAAQQKKRRRSFDNEKFKRMRRARRLDDSE